MGRDMIGRARTGIGKTLTFGIPILDRIIQLNAKHGDDNPESVLSSMQTIMVVLLEESEDVHPDLLSILLSTLGRDRRDVSGAARKLSLSIVQQCIEKLKLSTKQFLLSLISGDIQEMNSQVQYDEVIYDLLLCSSNPI
ncbi:DEAD-box ATP-dependent RNA helicase 9, mitochondrial-like isoform X2 [Vigna radiata var. radiata]|uniref:DEAD-box ATP-dependent RNA helicase 9, mitochondrial-like isoform X2 n=1 Tax=Vigna radiata var. radiata TaxID=3916 RepID=A0A1S3UKJ7_VIGRR|nr:DEAD-box ATP-dependent RNA helicase 9, mitochondrial-like isoform X2 [Vigna radiata var. radiata]XP_022641571.1 DEAD-box ATP-dependent RNA helicase 9, mitochondrial-like isoform X2 [Vigna radiata var. radiata]